jgi:hypothetical protein
MKSVPFRAVLLILLAIVAIGSVTTTSNKSKTTASNAVDGPCSEDGTTLVIEFGPLEQGSILRCVKNFSGTSWELFEAAQLSVEGTADYPNSFVCRIQDLPSAEVEPCDGTPNMQIGSWIYFVANAADEPGNWQRSPLGASSRTPKCGDSEAWVFSKDTNASPLTMPSRNECR